MPLAPDPRYLQTGVFLEPRQGLAAPVAPEPDAPGVLDVLSAAARQSNIGGAAYARFANRDPDLPDAPEGWDPMDHLDGFEDDAFGLMDAQSPSDLQGRKNRILESRKDREVLQRAGWAGTGAELTAGLFDPSWFVAAALPEKLLAKGIQLGRVSRAVVEGATGAAAYETALQGLQEDRSLGSSLLNVGAGALLSGVLGGLLNRTPGDELAPIREALDAEFRQMSTVGAAAARPATTLADETIAAGGEGLSRALGKTPLLGTDLDVIMRSESVAARQVLQDMADVTPMLAKNEQGIRTPDSAENAVTRHEAGVADFIDLSKEQWTGYRKRVTGAEGRLSQKEFYSLIARAARNGDNVGIPEVDKAASTLRAKVFEPLWDDAKRLGLYEDPAKAAQQRMQSRAEGKYVRAESRQQYANYAASRNAALKPKDFGKFVDEEIRLPGSSTSEIVRQAGDELAGIKVRLDKVTERAEVGLSTARQAETIGLGKASKMADDALKTFEQQMKQLEVPNTPGTRGTFGIAQLRKSLAQIKATTKEAIQTSREQRLSVTASEKSTSVQRRAAREANRAEVQKLKADFRQSAVQMKADLRQALTEAKLAARTAENADLRKSARAQVKTVRKLERTLQQIRTAERAERATAAVEAKRIRTEAATERKALREQAAQIRKNAFAQFAGPNRPMTRKQFLRAAKSREGVASEVEEVRNVAKLLQDRASGRLNDRVRAPQLDPRYLQKLLTDKSYFTRMYDRNLIRSNLSDWQQTLKNWFMRSGDASEAEVTAAIDDVTKKILGQDIGIANFATRISAPAAGPLKDRTLDIPSNLIEQFLVNDPIKIARAYTRELAPQVELARRGLDNEGLKQNLQNVADEYGRLKQVARDTIKDKAKLNKRLKVLSDEEQKTSERLLAVRDRVLGRAGLMDPNASSGERLAVQAARGWRNWVASTRLGATAITGGVMDLAKVTAQYGFAPTMKKLTQLVASPAFRDFHRKQGRRAGVVIEVALSKRVQAAYEGAVTEGWTDKMAHGVYKWTGLNHIMDFNRTLTAALFEDEVLKAAQKVASGGALTKFKRTQLASLGLGDAELKQVAEQVAKHGGKMDGVRISGSALWDNKPLADMYDAAILKDSHISVQQPGAADRVWWMDSETGKFIGQLKSFALSAPSRLLTPGLQMAGQGAHLQAARFFGYMLIGGYLTHALRQTLAGRKPITEPGKAFNEALTESGMAGVLPDIIEPPLRLFGESLGLKAAARYSDRNIFAAYGGPALGQVQDVFGMLPRVADGEFTQADLHALRRTFIPGQNMWQFRRAINALEGETGEALELEGATQDTFINRVLETETPK